MKKIQALVVSAALAIGMAAPASAGVSDPEVIIYRFPGVRDDGNNDNVGVATVFHCTNFSGVTETIRFVTRAVLGQLITNLAFNLNHLQTGTFSTHATNAYANDTALNTGSVYSGDNRNCGDREQHYLHGRDHRRVDRRAHRYRATRDQVQPCSRESGIGASRSVDDHRRSVARSNTSRPVGLGLPSARYAAANARLASSSVSVQPEDRIPCMNTLVIDVQPGYMGNGTYLTHG